jgi:hypothetical protein
LKQDDGFSKKDHLKNAHKQTGELPEELANAPKLPEAASYLWAYFLHLHRQRQISAGGVQPLSYGEIEAWTRLMKQPLDPWELNTLLRVDNAFLKVQQQKRNKGKP